MRLIHYPLGFCLCVLLAITGCSGGEVRSWPERITRMGYQMQPPVDGIRNYSVEGWHDLDAQHIIIETGTPIDYLITLEGDCDGLGGAVTIGFSSVNGDLALSDQLIIRQIDSNYKCPLKAINPLQRGNQTRKG